MRHDQNELGRATYQRDLLHDQNEAQNPKPNVAALPDCPGLLAAGHDTRDILRLYPYLEAGDVEEIDVPRAGV